ncbi:MAG: RloB domain-containing protein [Solibacillus sp.]
MDDLTERKLEEVDEFFGRHNIHFTYTNEAFELWLLLHFEQIDVEKVYPCALLNEKVGQ